MSNLHKYEYDVCPLEDPSRDIRIIDITKSQNPSLEVSLRVERPRRNGTADKLIYNALSWCWRSFSGEAQEQETISIVHHDRRYAFEVSKNLADALRTLRDKPDPVWVDWICIDQKNVEERNNQVQLMSTIYGEASCVYVWLGPHFADSKAAFDFIPELLKMEQFQDLVSDKNPTIHHKWKALKNLMMRDWFSRRWIIQEIALAHRAQLLCGNSELDWKDFADAVSLFNLYETETRAISKIMMGQSAYDHQPDYFGSIPALGAARLVETTDHLFEPGGGANASRNRQQSLEYLVSTFTPFNASEARDTIYAILAIAKDSTPRTQTQLTGAYKAMSKPEEEMLVDVDKITRKSAEFAQTLRTFASIVDKHSTSKPYHVDYSLPISDVYVDFVRFSIERAEEQDPFRALDILCRSWAPDPDYPLVPERSTVGHGHWRSAFTFKKGYDGMIEVDRFTNRQVEQSPRDSLHILNEYQVPEHHRDARVRKPALGATSSVISRDTIPSWAPSTKRAPFAWNKTSGDDRKMTRQNADQLVGDPSQRIYSASGKKGVTKIPRFEDGVVEDKLDQRVHNTHYHSIYVEGFVLGIVDELSDRSQGGQIPSRWADLIEADPGASSEFWSRRGSEDFWRTLVGDRGVSASNPPRCVGRILSGHYTGLSDLDLKETIFYSKHQPAASFYRHIHATIWNRKFMRMSKVHDVTDEADGYHIGLAPDDAERLDLVVVLYGCSVPVILRKYTKTDSVLQSQRRQQKAKAGRRIWLWWQCCRQANKLLKYARAYEARQRITGNGGQHECVTPPSRIRPAAKRSINTPRGGKRKPTFDLAHDIADATTRASKRRRHNRTQTEPITPTQLEGNQSSKSPMARRHGGPSQDVTQQTSVEHDDKVFYRLIGECYVHRMMRGEAIEHQVERHLPSVLFEIR